MRHTKIILLFVLVMVFLLSACSDDTITNSGSNSNTISGKIENWKLGNNMKLKVRAQSNQSYLVIDSTFIDSAGNFSFNKVTPPDSLFSTFNINDTTCFNTITVNPSGTRQSFISLYVYDSLNLLGYLVRSSDSLFLSHTGQTKADFLCVDRISTITGLDSCYQGGTISISVWNASFIRGWNTIYVTYNSYTPPNYFKVTVATSQSQAMKWYMFGYLFK